MSIFPYAFQYTYVYNLVYCMVLLCLAHEEVKLKGKRSCLKYVIVAAVTLLALCQYVLTELNYSLRVRKEYFSLRHYTYIFLTK